MTVDEPVVLSQIVITRRYYPARPDRETSETVHVKVDGDPPLIEQLGLIEFARMTVSADALRAELPDDNRDE